MWGVLITTKRRYFLKCTENTAREYKPLLPNSQTIPSSAQQNSSGPEHMPWLDIQSKGSLIPWASPYLNNYQLLFATRLSMFWTGASLPLQLVLRLRWCERCGYLLLIWLVNYFYSSFFFSFFQIEETNKEISRILLKISWNHEDNLVWGCSRL